MSYQTAEEAVDTLGASCARYLDAQSFSEAIAKIRAEAVRELFEDMDPSEMAPERVERYIVDVEEGRR